MKALLKMLVSVVAVVVVKHYAIGQKSRNANANIKNIITKCSEKD